jgi:putative redox protein
MTVKISLTYQGELRCEAVHGPSGRTLITDAPVDNHGRGESFSPTDLLATGLGGCMATIMGIRAAKKNLDLAGLTVSVEKGMIEGPRRIGTLAVIVRGPKKIPQIDRAELEEAAMNCPVFLSLHPDIQKPVTFLWDL